MSLDTIVLPRQHQGEKPKVWFNVSLNHICLKSFIIKETKLKIDALNEHFCTL